ncbi:MAG: hypothetical protein WCR08_08945 [Gammaproteobacteria bacterium]
MNDSYEAFVAYNRQLLVDAAREKNIILTINDLQDISGPQIPLTMMADEFLDALQEELFSVQDITQVYNGFREFFTAHLAERPTTGDLLSDAMPSNGWIIVQAENAMTNLIRQMITPAYLDALRTERYDMSYVCQQAKDRGLKSLPCLHPDLLTALEEQRITEEDIDEMSYDDLVEAISENRYRQDSSHSYN